MNELEKMATGELTTSRSPRSWRASAAAGSVSHGSTPHRPTRTTEYRRGAGRLMPHPTLGHGHPALPVRPRAHDPAGAEGLRQYELHVPRQRRHHGRRPHAHRPQLPALHAAAPDRLPRTPPDEESARPIVIGSDCWLGGGVIVCPGVRIGDRSIIAAGASSYTTYPKIRWRPGIRPS